MSDCCPSAPSINGVPPGAPAAPATSSTIYVDTSPLDITADNSERVVATHTFAGGSLPYTNAIVKLSSRFSFTNRVNGTVRQQFWRFYFGGVLLWGAGWNTTGATAYVPRPLRFDFELAIQSQSFQLLSGYVTMFQGTPSPNAGGAGVGAANADNESNVSSLGTLDPVLQGGGSTADLANPQTMAFTYQANGTENTLHLVRLGSWIELLDGS